MRKIGLTNGGSTIVDEKDFTYLNQFTWRSKLSDGTKKCYHAVRDVRLPTGKKLTIRMHTLITETRYDQYVIHINGNTLDNRRRNLQVRTKNPWTGRTKDSGFRGVHQVKSKKWKAEIEFAGRKHNLGDEFATAKDAAMTYDKAARDLYGRNAITNF